MGPQDSPLLQTSHTYTPDVIEDIQVKAGLGHYRLRGFGILQLHRGTGWPFWIVVWPSAILFGLSHTEQGQSMLESVGLFFLLGSGGVIFAWLVYRWQNLWVPLMLHICMNLWWELFSVSRNAIGGWFPFALQILTMLLAIIATRYLTRPKILTVAPSN